MPEFMPHMVHIALKHDEKGNALKEIDWEHTKAVATRGGHIYINLKGRNPHGIVTDMLLSVRIKILLQMPDKPVRLRSHGSCAHRQWWTLPINIRWRKS